jgi:cyclase
VGKPEIAIEFLNRWGIDEIILLDISASKNKKKKQFDYINQITGACFVPLTVGGGIDCLDDIQSLLSLGADKISLNSHAIRFPEFISEASKIFGNQCIVVSIDVVGSSEKNYRVFDASKNQITDLIPVEWAKKVETSGAGEIFLTSVDRDGCKQGFDLPLIDSIARNVGIPVIASGGAGNASHIRDVFTCTGASAVSAANYFHFFEHSVIVAKAVLANTNHSIRLNTHANYSKSPLDENFRLAKHSDHHLQNLLFEKIEKEII